MVETTASSESVAGLGKALAAAQGEMVNPVKDSVNPHFKSRYADLAAVRDAVIPVLAKHKLAVLQLPCEADGNPALVTLLIHESGEWVSTTMLLRPGKQDPQGIGSALTYARRYALQSLAGVAAEDDDDGERASKPTPAPAQKPVVKPEPDREPDTSDTLARLIGKMAELRRLTPVEIWAKLKAAKGWQDADMYDDLHPTQVTSACDSLRATLAQTPKAAS